MTKPIRMPGESSSSYAARAKRLAEVEANARQWARKNHTPAPKSFAPTSYVETVEEWYSQHRETPLSKRRRKRHRNNIPSDALSGGGEAFADRSAWSITRWWRGC